MEHRLSPPPARTGTAQHPVFDVWREGSGTATLSPSCQLPGPQEAALSLVKSCECQADSDYLNKVAIETVRIFSAVEEAQTMGMPYPPSDVGGAEEREELFDLWQSLLCQPDSKSPMMNQANPQAKSLWPNDPSHADRLLWARQALENPEMDHQILNPADSNALLQQKKEESTATKSNTLSDSDITQWIQKWCQPFGIPPFEWILLIPPEALSMERSIQQVRENAWGCLVAVLQKVFTELGFESMLSKYLHPVIHEQWKRPGNHVAPQCLVFMARAYCASRLLHKNVKDSPTLLAKLLRCIQLLQHPNHRDEAQSIGSLWNYYKGATRPRRPVSWDNSTQTESAAENVVDCANETSESCKASQEHNRTSSPSREFKSDLDSDGRSSEHTENTSFNDATSLACRRPWHGKKLRTDDPVVVKLLQEAGTIDKLLKQYPVQRLDFETGELLRTFATGNEALESVSDTLVNLDFFQSLMGRRITNTDTQGHFYKGYFWRCKGSKATPNPKPSSILNDSPWAPTGTTKAGSQEGDQRVDKVVAGQSSQSCTSDSTKAAAVRGDNKNELPEASYPSDDPVVAKLYQKAGTIEMFLQQYPVEKLNFNTGEVLETFPSALQALQSVSDAKTVFPFFQVLMGRRKTVSDPQGHWYKGFFWRCKGSTVKPICNESSSENLRHSNESPKANASSWDRRRLAKPTDDPYAARLMRRAHKRDDLLRYYPVEKLHPQTGCVLETFPSGHAAMAGLRAPPTSTYSVRLYQSLLGRRGAKRHVYLNYFWRFQGSSAEPLNRTMKSWSEERKANRTGPDNISCSPTKSDRLDPENSGKKTLESTTVDPFVAKLLNGGKSRSEILRKYPVEKLDGTTGVMLETFPNGLAALASISDTRQPQFFYCTLLGARVTSNQKMLGHFYKGFFWRLKGSQVLPSAAVKAPAKGEDSPLGKAATKQATGEDCRTLKLDTKTDVVASEDEMSLTSEDGDSSSSSGSGSEEPVNRMTASTFAQSACTDNDEDFWLIDV